MTTEQQCEVLYTDKTYTISSDESRIVIRRKAVDWGDKLRLFLPVMMNLSMLSACLIVFGVWVYIVVDVIKGNQPFNWGTIFSILFMMAWWCGGILLIGLFLRYLCTFLFGCEKWLEESGEFVYCGLRLFRRLVIKRKLKKPLKLIARVAPLTDSGWSISLRLKGERGLGTTLVNHVSARTKTKASEKLEQMIAVIGSQFELPVEWELHKRRSFNRGN